MARVGEAAMMPTNVIHSVPVTLSARAIADAIWTASALASSVDSLGRPASSH
jgi:glycerol dehydrogenase